MKNALFSWPLFYPVYLFCKKMQGCWDSWRLGAFVKQHGLPLYIETETQQLNRELVLMDILRQMQAEFHWLPKPLFPVGGAANHALLYLLARSLEEHRPERILELGIGQSSRVLSGYSHETGANVVSLDESPFWVEKMRSHCNVATHQLLHTALITTPRGRWYDIQSVKSFLPTAGFELVLVDGPTGTRRYSRAGVIDWFLDNCPQDWLVIWDDLQRLADLESFTLFVETARSKGIVCEVAFCRTGKTIGLAFTKRYESVRFYF